MTTVTAKTLRDNLSQYLDKLENGEEIMIIRHSEIIGILKPVNPTSISNGQAIAAMLERNKGFFKDNASLSPREVPAKELYHQTLEKKYNA